MEFEQDADNHEKNFYIGNLMSMSLIDRILELTDATGLTDFPYWSDRSSQSF
jgi:hypothetical protein